MASATRDTCHRAPGALRSPSRPATVGSVRVVAPARSIPMRVAIVAVVAADRASTSLIIGTAGAGQRSGNRASARPRSSSCSPTRVTSIAPAGVRSAPSSATTSPGRSRSTATSIPQDQVTHQHPNLGTSSLRPGAGQGHPRSSARAAAHGDDRVVAGTITTVEAAKAQARSSAATPGRSTSADRSSSSASNAGLVEDRDAELLGLGELRSRALADHDVARLLRHARRDLAAARGDLGRGFVARAVARANR